MNPGSFFKGAPIVYDASISEPCFGTGAGEQRGNGSAATGVQSEHMPLKKAEKAANYRRSPRGLTYSSYHAMHQRCLNERHNRYPSYGGVGITICERWRESFENFLEDMGERPSMAHSLDRYPNNQGNYEPGNCRWATLTEQANNKKPRKRLSDDERKQRKTERVLAAYYARTGGRTRGSNTCRKCGGAGHQARTCDRVHSIRAGQPVPEFPRLVIAKVKVPTARQVTVLRAIVESMDRTGAAPSIDELGRALGISRRGAHDHLASMRRKGLLADNGRTKRPWSITEYGASFLRRDAEVA